MFYNQCNQIGRFLKVLVDRFSYKSDPNTRWRLGFLEKIMKKLPRLLFI